MCIRDRGGYLRALELLEEKELPTAVLASYDQMAFGVMRAFREKGIEIPEDISIVGFDNTVMDNYYPVPLTSVTNPVEQMGVTATKILLDAIDNPVSHVGQNVALDVYKRQLLCQKQIFMRLLIKPTT